MPLYTYRCYECDHVFETRQRMSDDPLNNCPVCPGEVRRVINSVGVVFKGNGFYITDNRNGRSANGVNGASADKTTDSTDKSKEKVENKSKAKPETKTAVQPAP
jgi:putative FmdB family regulatory protein